MGRSRWKGYIFDRIIYKKFIKILLSFSEFNSVFIKKDSSIPKFLSPFNIKIMGGRTQKKIQTTIFNRAHKAGCYVFTRKPFYYPSKKIMKNLK